MASLEEIVEALAQHPFTHDFTEEEQRSLAALSTLQEFEPGTLIVHEGRAADSFFLILEGMVAVEMLTPSHGRLRLQTIEAGEVVGWSWMVPPYRWTFDARALTPVKAIVIDAEKLREQFEGCPFCYRFLRRLLEVVAKRLDATRLRLMDLYLDVAQGQRGPSTL